MKIKLIIWDLDDTLWRGSLAEGEEVELIEPRARFVKDFNGCGIVSSLCSKNDYETAQSKLKEFGLFDAFVFPRISFQPKAPVLAEVIKTMRLRAENVLFVDDNPHNLNEAKALLPDLHVVDATSPACDRLLTALWEENKYNRKSRVEEYRILETKQRALEEQNISPEVFLQNSGIHVVLSYSFDSLDFCDRIEELVNRSNQLNFLKTRYAPGAVRALISDAPGYYPIALFVWDKYGYYGLVGFVVVHRPTNVVMCFAFSCRIMHMGIEAWALARIKEIFPSTRTDNIPVVPDKTDWIAEVSFADPRVRAKIYEGERAAQPIHADLRIMVNCQSGAIAHYSGLIPAGVDNRYQHFSLADFLGDNFTGGFFPPYLVVGTFSDYVFDWPCPGDSTEAQSYRRCVRRFLAHAQKNGCELLLLIAPEEAPSGMFVPRPKITQTRMREFNAIWREEAATSACASLLEIASFARLEDMIDVRHYRPSLLKQIGDEVARWYRERNSGEA